MDVGAWGTALGQCWTCFGKPQGGTRELLYVSYRVTIVKFIPSILYLCYGIGYF
jgi:hypothetical protein